MNNFQHPHHTALKPSPNRPVGTQKANVGHAHAKNNATAQSLFDQMNQEHMRQRQMSEQSAGLPNADMTMAPPHSTDINNGVPPEMDGKMSKEKSGKSGEKSKGGKGGKSKGIAPAKGIKNVGVGKDGKGGMGLNELFGDEERNAMAMSGSPMPSMHQ